MTLTLGDWHFQVDITQTMTVSGEESAEHCVCAYCRNFYSAIDSVHPNLRLFLSQFGLDLDAPDELIPYFSDGEVWYTGCFSVTGTILRMGRHIIRVDGADILPSRECIQTVSPTAHEPRFYLILRDVRLPWVLQEEPEPYPVQILSTLPTRGSPVGARFLS